MAGTARASLRNTNHVISTMPIFRVGLFLDQVSDFTDMYISIRKPRGASEGYTAKALKQTAEPLNNNNNKYKRKYINIQ